MYTAINSSDIDLDRSRNELMDHIGTAADAFSDRIYVCIKDAESIGAGACGHGI